jgi:predicted CopG family antitoxin
MMRDSNNDTSHVLKTSTSTTDMGEETSSEYKAKTIGISRENFRRMQRLGVASESMNDVIERMLSIAEQPLLIEIEKSFLQQKQASSQRQQQRQQPHHHWNNKNNNNHRQHERKNNRKQPPQQQREQRHR